MTPKKSTKQPKNRVKKSKLGVHDGIDFDMWPPTPVSQSDDWPVGTVKDIGPYPVWSTALLCENGAWDNDSRRTIRFFCYHIGGLVSGAQTALSATRLETNMNVANQFVDERMNITNIELVIPRVAMATYQINPKTGHYAVSDEDLQSLVAETHASFYVGGDKPFAECVLAQKSLRTVDSVIGNPEMGDILEGVGGWVARIADFSDHPLPVGRIEKFWGELNWPRAFPSFGKHGYNPAVIPVTMVLNGTRTRGVQ